MGIILKWVLKEIGHEDGLDSSGSG